MHTGLCPDGFFDDGWYNCYMFFDGNAVTAQQAQSICQQNKNSNLPVFQSWTEIMNYNALASVLIKFCIMNECHQFYLL